MASNIPGPAPGEDTLTGSSGNDTVTGSSGTDTTTGATGNDTLAATDGERTGAVLPPGGNIVPGTTDGGKTFDRDGTERGAGFAMGGAGLTYSETRTTQPQGDGVPDPATERARYDGKTFTTPQRRVIPDTPPGLAVSLPSGSEPQHIDTATGRPIVS